MIMHDYEWRMSKEELKMDVEYALIWMKDNSKQYLQFYSHQYTLFTADMQISNYGFRITRNGQKKPLILKLLILRIKKQFRMESFFTIYRSIKLGWKLKNIFFKLDVKSCKSWVIYGSAFLTPYHLLCIIP